jgi:exopolysaccharide biosynthesis polyprenyl glycosylphosphotransferase
MFRERAILFNRLLFIVDLVVTCGAFHLAYWSRNHLDLVLPSSLDALLNPYLYPEPHYFPVIGLSIAWWAVVAHSLGLYRISMRRSGREKVWKVFDSSIFLGIFLGVLAFALKLDLSRPLIALFVIYQMLILTSIRLLVLFHIKGKGPVFSIKYSRNILIVGASPTARRLGDLISNYAEWGLEVIGYVDAEADRPIEPHGDVLGSVSDLHHIVDNHIVEEIIYAEERPNMELLDKILELCSEQGIRARLAADFFPAKVANLSMEFLENIPVISFSSAPEYTFSLFVKRVLDVVISAVVLLLLLPFFAIVGLLVKLTSKGPIIYRQVRCGLYGRKFILYKVRSMFDGAEDVLWEIRHLNEMAGPVFKMRNDPRVTQLGRFLRKSSIDELPQFWNVLKGDMSLVGPRAPLPEEVKEYTRWQRRRLSVKPGITCLWQVSGRNEIDFHEWMKLDLHYIDNWSLLLDFKILLRTFPVVLFGKGAR